MAIYEYICKNCMHHFEDLVRMGDYNDKVCPRCGALARKIISTPSFNFAPWQEEYDSLAKEALNISDEQLVNKYKGVGADFGRNSKS